MPTAAFSAVSDESRGRDRYSADLHERIDSLVQEWLELPQGENIAFAAGNRAFGAEVKACDTWVRSEYVARYGDEHRIGPFGCPAFILIAVLSGIISWLVQRTLDHLYPRAGADGFR